MSTKQRIYTVTCKDGGPARLVRAAHPAHALKHVAESQFSVRVADQETLVSLIDLGAKVEDIKAEQMELPQA